MANSRVTFKAKMKVGFHKSITKHDIYQNVPYSL